MKEEEIIERFRNPDYPAIIIAEIGSNFDGSLDIAIEMIKIAADAGCDFAKFQLFSADALVPLKSHAHTVLSPLELNREWIPNLVDACLENDIGFCASPFDFDAVDRLFDNGGAPFYKIASPEVHDIPLIEYVATKGRPIVISTGFMTPLDIQCALDVIKESGDPEVCVLHCVSDYPTDPVDANLGMIKWLKERFAVNVGLSDHSLQNTIPFAAIVLGARVIEKHFTLGQRRLGPDHHFAIEPDQLNSMVKGIREIEQALGKSKKYPTPHKDEQLSVNNKGLVAAQDITPGTRITKGMLAVKRVPNGIRPKDIYVVIDRVAKSGIKFDEAIEWDKLK